METEAGLVVLEIVVFNGVDKIGVVHKSDRVDKYRRIVLS